MQVLFDVRAALARLRALLALSGGAAAEEVYEALVRLLEVGAVCLRTRAGCWVTARDGAQSAQ